MAITDVRELRSFEFSESLESKGKVTLQGSVDLLALHDSLPDFAALAEDSTSWPNLSGGKIPQVGDMRLIAGVLFKVKGRKFAFYKGDDADRAVKITLSYEAQKEDTEQPTPEEEDEESWQRLSVTTEQKECPLDDHGANGEFDNDPKSAKNSAGDPLDGLTENRCLLRFKYTNTKVATPNFNTLTKYVNTTNDQPFIGGARRTMLCLGYNAEYDDKQSVWTVSVEWLYDPKGHVVTVWDAGFNELVNNERRAILDVRGNPVSKPVPLDGNGQAVAAASLVPPYASGNMAQLTFYPYPEKSHGNIFSEAGI